MVEWWRRWLVDIVVISGGERRLEVSCGTWLVVVVVVRPWWWCCLGMVQVGGIAFDKWLWWFRLGMVLTGGFGRDM